MVNSRKKRSLRSRLESFCKQHHVGILYVFGSRGAEIRKMLDEDAGVEPAKSSDVDIAVKLSGDRTLSVREKTELSVTMENLLGVDRADVILLSEADPFLAVKSSEASACSALINVKPTNTNSMFSGAPAT